MERISKKITNFMDLNAWKEGHKLVLQVYKSTNKFPIRERYGLGSQVERAVVSITSNIAEGFSRLSGKEKNNFYYFANSSLTEAQNQMLIARDLGYIDRESFERIWRQTIIVQKLINGLIKSIKNRRLNNP